MWRNLPALSTGVTQISIPTLLSRASTAVQAMAQTRSLRRTRSSPLTGAYLAGNESIHEYTRDGPRMSSVSHLSSLNSLSNKSESTSQATSPPSPSLRRVVHRTPSAKPTPAGGSVASIPPSWQNDQLPRLDPTSSHIVLPISAEHYGPHQSFRSTSERTQVIRATSSEGGNDTIGASLSEDPPSNPLDNSNKNHPKTIQTGVRPTTRLQENPPLTFLRNTVLLPNRQALFSIPASPNCLNLEFDLITDGEDTGMIVVSPRSEKSFPTSNKMITTPSVPTDVGTLSPTSNLSLSKQSIPRLSVKPRTHAPCSDRKPSRKSLVHKRVSTEVDSVLFATNPIRKDTSFLSFASDGSDDDEDLGEAEELISDILALPVSPLHLNAPTIQNSSFPMPPQTLPRTAKPRPGLKVLAPPPTTELPSPPSTFAPTKSRFRTPQDDDSFFSPPSMRSGTNRPHRSPSSPSIRTSIDRGDRDSSSSRSPSSPTIRTSMDRGDRDSSSSRSPSDKALGILGIDAMSTTNARSDETFSTTSGCPLDEPLLRRNPSTATKALEVLGVYDDKSSYTGRGTLALPRTLSQKQKRGGKLWRILTGGSKCLEAGRT